MLTSGVSLANHFKNGQGIQSIEQRVNVLESRIQQLTGQKVAPPNTPSEFQKTFEKTLNKTTAPVQVAPAQTSPKLTVSGTIQHRYKALQPTIKRLSQKYGVDSRLINAVVKQESGFQPDVVSKAGAQGLMQLMPATAKSLGVKNAFDPAENLDGGVRYLKGLMTEFNNNMPMALAAYNAGPNAVKKYGHIPPYKETQNYVRNILANYLKQTAAS